MDELSAPRRESKRRFAVGPLTLCFVISLFAFVCVPVLWVLAYRVIPIPGTMLMVDRAFAGENARAQWVGLPDISPNLVRSAIGAEDSRFCSHDGFDFEAIETALKANARAANSKRGRVRGGSTISQQTAKNVFAWADRNWARKGVETYYTVLMEALWPKDRVIEAYLNVAEWGDGRFGAEAAARDLFSVGAAGLSERQAAALAAVLPSPNRWNAVAPGRYVRARIGAIVSRARVVGGDGLASCVLAGRAPATRAPSGKAPPPRVLPPLPKPPPSEAPIAPDDSVEDAASFGVEASPLEPAPEPPADLRGTDSEPSPAEPPAPTPEVPAPG